MEEAKKQERAADDMKDTDATAATDDTAMDESGPGVAEDADKDAEVDNEAEAEAAEKAADDEAAGETAQDIVQDGALDVPDDVGESKAAATEKKKEPEVDAEPDDGERVKQVALNDFDATLDVFVSGEGCIVSSLSQGGFQHLLSGIRANVGVKSGRYLFEVKVLERVQDAETTLRVGASLAKSSLFLGDGTTDHICFEQEGAYLCPSPEDPNAKREKACKQRFALKVVGIVMNLDTTSPVANTLSIFLDGVRMGEPQPIPEHLHGKALYPTVTFKNATLAVNLGCTGLCLRRLPFRCRMLGDISVANAELASFARPPPGDKYSIIVPVGLPEEGFFDFVDHFLEDHPEFTELSDRSILEWCTKSGLTQWRKQQSWSTLDRPVFNFGVPGIDNKSWRPMLRTLAQLTKRNLILVEAKGNLISKEREDVVKRFAAEHFTVVAQVAVGEPAEEHRKWVQERTQAKFKDLDAKAGEDDKLMDEDGDADEKGTDADTKDGEQLNEHGSEEPAKKKARTEESGLDAEMSAPADVSKASKEVWWIPRKKGSPPDVAPKIIAQSYLGFTFPADTEGFDKIEFVWRPKVEAGQYLQNYISEKKASMIIEDLTPSEWFKEKLQVWKKTLSEMKKKHREILANKDKKKGTKDIKEDAKESKPKDGENAETKEDVRTGQGSEDQGPPAFADFKHEDWLLLSWRYELHILAHSFIEDAKEHEYPGVPCEHIAHYYHVYFKSTYNPKQLGVSSLEDIVDLTSDTVKISAKGSMNFVEAVLGKEAEVKSFVELVEECRQDRERRIEAGDESAMLTIPAAKPEAAKGKGRGKGQRKQADIIKRGVKQQWTKRRIVSKPIKGARSTQGSKGEDKKMEKSQVIPAASNDTEQPKRNRPWERNKIGARQLRDRQQPAQQREKWHRNTATVGSKWENKRAAPGQTQRGLKRTARDAPKPPPTPPPPNRPTGHQGRRPEKTGGAGPSARHDDVVRRPRQQPAREQDHTPIARPGQRGPIGGGSSSGRQQNSRGFVNRGASGTAALPSSGGSRQSAASDRGEIMRPGKAVSRGNARDTPYRESGNYRGSSAGSFKEGGSSLNRAPSNKASQSGNYRSDDRRSGDNRFGTYAGKGTSEGGQFRGKGSNGNAAPPRDRERRRW